jgi:hypothetical protein
MAVLQGVGGEVPGWTSSHTGLPPVGERFKKGNAGHGDTITVLDRDNHQINVCSARAFAPMQAHLVVLWNWIDANCSPCVSARVDRNIEEATLTTKDHK